MGAPGTHDRLTRIEEECMQFSAPRVWRARSRSLLPGGFSPPEARLGTPLLSCVNLGPGIILPSYQVISVTTVLSSTIVL